MEEKITAWVTRDKDGTLCLWQKKPYKMALGWGIKKGSIFNDDVVLLKKKKFSSVKWEDKEPTEVEITIKQK